MYNPHKKDTFSKNFPWEFFCTGVILLILSLFFKANDMAAVCSIPIIGSVVLFIYFCYSDRASDRRFEAYKAALLEESRQRNERL